MTPSHRHPLAPLAGTTRHEDNVEEGEGRQAQDTEVRDGRPRVGDGGVDVDADTQAGPQAGVTVETPRHVTYGSGSGPRPEGTTEVRPGPGPGEGPGLVGTVEVRVAGEARGATQETRGQVRDLARLDAPTCPGPSREGVGRWRQGEEGQVPRADAALPVRPPPADTVVVRDAYTGERRSLRPSPSPFGSVPRKAGGSEEKNRRNNSILKG